MLFLRRNVAKYRAVVREIERRHATGQPMLIGTTSIEQSEQLSHMLKEAGIVHNVLNAKYHELEAQIVAQTGQKAKLLLPPTWPVGELILF